MSDDPQQQPTPPANAAEAAARLGTLQVNPEWTGLLLGGDAAATKEWHALHGLIASADDRVSSAMAGTLPEVPDSDHRLMSNTASLLRDLGVSEPTIQQTLEGREVTQQEYDAVVAWKTQHLRDKEWTKSLLAGDVEAVKQFTLANIVLSSTVKKEKAA
jgi:hypothetical protein